MDASTETKPNIVQNLRQVDDSVFPILLENASEGIVIVDGRGNIVLTNAKVESLFGYAHAELLGQPAEILVPERHRLAHTGHRATYLTQPRNRPMGVGLDLTARRKDGTEFPVEISLSHITTNDGILVMASIMDISLRKRVESALQRHTERLKILHEIDRAILSAHAPAEIAQAVATRIQSLIPCHQADVTLFDFESSASTLLAGVVNQDLHLETVRTLPLGEMRNIWKLKRGEVLAVADLVKNSNLSEAESKLMNEGIRAYISAPLIAGDQLVGSFNLRWAKPNAYTQEDIEVACEVADQIAVAIRQAQLDSKLQQSNAALRKALRAKDEMLQNVSHELRTPLTHIIGYAEAMIDAVLGELNDEQTQAIKVIHDRAQALSRLVETLLSFHSLTPDRMNWERVDLKTLIDGVVRIWLPRARQAKIDLQLAAIPSLPAVSGDYMRLRQVFDQLLDNAIKFTPSGGEVHVRAEIRGDEIWFSVSDTGIGIPPDKKETVFEPFYQVNGSITRTHGGMGIGLGLVQQIVALHNGRAWAESDGITGHGSTFYVALPVEHTNTA